MATKMTITYSTRSMGLDRGSWIMDHGSWIMKVEFLELQRQVSGCLYMTRCEAFRQGGPGAIVYGSEWS